MYGTRLYHVWNGMMGRCGNPNNKDFSIYGGRGITVCDEWKTPDIFFDWALKNGYGENLTLDRIDTNGGYSPSNCRWVTNLEQQRNKRNNKMLSFNGETHCVAEWSEITGIDKRTINSRLILGWSIERALTCPVQHHKPTVRRKANAR